MEKNKDSFLTDKIALSLFLIGLACIFFRWGFARKHAIPASALFLLLHSVSFCQANEPTRIWRTQENETINALYLLLKCDNLPCDYAELEAELKSSSSKQNLDVLKKQAQKRGLKLTIDFDLCETKPKDPKRFTLSAFGLPEPDFGPRRMSLFRIAMMALGGLMILVALWKTATERKEKKTP